MLHYIYIILLITNVFFRFNFYTEIIHNRCKSSRVYTTTNTTIITAIIVVNKYIADSFRSFLSMV